VLADRTAPPWLRRRDGRRLAVHGRGWGTGVQRVAEPCAALCQVCLAHAVGQAAQVAPPVEPMRWDVQHEPPQACHGIQRQGTQAMAGLVVLVAQGHRAILQGDEPVVGDGHTRRGAGEVGEDRLGGLERLFRRDAPGLVAHGGEAGLPVRGPGACPTTTRQGELAPAIERREPRQAQPPKTPREHANGPAAGRPTWPPLGASRGSAPGWEHTMEMRVMGQGLAPGVEDGEAAHLGPEMLRIPSHVLERRGHGVQEEPREQARVLECQGPQGVRQGNAHLAVGGLKDFPLSSGEPCGWRRAMTFGAATVAAGVVGLARVATLGALGEMAPESRAPAHGARPQGPMLRTRARRPIPCQTGGAMRTPHLGDCARRRTHGRWPNSAGKARASRGLSVAWSAGCAPWRERLGLRRRACPSSNGIRRRSTPAARRCVAKL